MYAIESLLCLSIFILISNKWERMICSPYIKIILFKFNTSIFYSSIHREIFVLSTQILECWNENESTDLFFSIANLKQISINCVCSSSLVLWFYIWFMFRYFDQMKIFNGNICGKQTNYQFWNQNLMLYNNR